MTRRHALRTALLVMLLMVSPMVVYAGHSTLATGAAYLHPANHSGVLGVIQFVDDGTTLTVVGTATGLDPTAAYISLVYDNGSVPGGPGTPPQANNPAFQGLCEPSTGDNITFDQMFIGAWNVNSDGTGSLGPVDKTGASYVSLDLFDTVSIRFPAPGPENVQACGEVADHPGQ